jgi:hypothetical protein
MDVCGTLGVLDTAGIGRGHPTERVVVMFNFVVWGLSMFGMAYIAYNIHEQEGK